MSDRSLRNRIVYTESLAREITKYLIAYRNLLRDAEFEGFSVVQVLNNRLDSISRFADYAHAIKCENYEGAPDEIEEVLRGEMHLKSSDKIHYLLFAAVDEIFFFQLMEPEVGSEQVG